jgi:ATP-binding cassette subfamily F protein uup
MSAPIIHCQAISKSFGLVPVFSNMDFTVQERDKIGIIGPNGAGKSTLLKILAGLDTADSGLVSNRRGLSAGYVAQQDDFPEGQTIRTILLGALGQNASTGDLGRLELILGRAGFHNPDVEATKLSGGWKKRLAICVQLLRHPQLLLLDEPTNHLDLAGIDWLEDVLDAANFAYAVISHDRYFLEAACTTIVEINRMYPGGNFIVKGGYGEYMRRKAEFIEGHASQMASMANRLRAESEWLSRGAQARSTKQQARIKAAAVLKADFESAQTRSRRQAVEFEFTASQRKTKKLMEVKNLSKSFGGTQLFNGLSFILGPGMRLGLSGPNGSGKSTLLKIFQKTLPPDAGTVEHADQLRVVYYDQHREELPEDRTLKRALAEDGDFVSAQGRSVHVATYAKSFGFDAKQLETTVKKLSGGERARLLIARMLQKPADVLILDEPTNDLDIDSLETLEESLLSFPGAIILVTHDRYLLDRVSTGILGLDGTGSFEFFADYAQYVLHMRQLRTSDARDPNVNRSPDQHSVPNNQTNRTTHKSKKLPYLEQREWDSMESNILKAEQALADAQAKSADPMIASSPIKLQEACKTVDAAQETVDKLYARWAELESKLKD